MVAGNKFRFENRFSESYFFSFQIFYNILSHAVLKNINVVAIEIVDIIISIISMVVAERCHYHHALCEK